MATVPEQVRKKRLANVKGEVHTTFGSKSKSVNSGLVEVGLIPGNQDEDTVEWVLEHSPNRLGR